MTARRAPFRCLPCAAALVALAGCSASPSASSSSAPGDGTNQPPDAGPATIDAAVPSQGPGSTGPKDASTGERADAASDPVTDASAPGSGSGPSMSSGGTMTPFKGVANSACNDLVSLRAAWYYNWTLSPGTCMNSVFVPMIWGHTGDEQSASGIAKEIGQIKSAGYGVVLGFNEPDNTSQSNLSVDTAISLWPAFDDPALRLGSPAPQGNSTGLAWLKSFLGQVDADTTGTLRVDFITIHWYGWNSGSCDAKAASLESYLKQVEALPGQRPIWLTEWGCLNQSDPTPDVVQAFFSGAVAMFARHPRLERYAWYPWTTNNELVSDGGLTSLGTAFAAEPTVK